VTLSALSERLVTHCLAPESRLSLHNVRKETKKTLEKRPVSPSKRILLGE
jgi:hypothetical protein